MSNVTKYFTNFKIHTQYSICEGAIKIPELAEYCKTNKVSAIGLSDSYNLCGALEFSQEISNTGAPRCRYVQAVENADIPGPSTSNRLL